ncbi:MAG: beta-ketoacyl synthase N-terminal-like domain-containing protein [Flavobacteriales bacterium]
MNKSIYIKAHASISALGHEPLAIAENGFNHRAQFSTLDGLPVAKLHPESKIALDQFISKHRHLKQTDLVVQQALFLADILNNKHSFDKNLLINIGSSRGASLSLESQYQNFTENNKLSVYTSPHTTLGFLSTAIGQYLEAKGAHFSHSMTCSTALHSLCNAYAWIQSGLTNAALCGGSEACISPFSLAMFSKLGIYQKQTQLDFPCRPLDKNADKNSMVLGEGAALFYVDDNKEGAIAEIEGLGFSTEQTEHLAGISENGKAYFESMSAACGNQDLSAIDYVFLHAPGTLKGDQAELKAIKTLFGNQQPNLYSTKCLQGHTLGASGALSLDFALQIFKNQTNIDFPYPSVNQNTKFKKPIERILINAAGFGGNSVSVLVKNLL